MRLSDRAAQLRPSSIRRIAERAGAARHPLIRLDIGEPDFPEPAVLGTIGNEIFAAGSSYLPTRGLPAFREALAREFTTIIGTPIEADGVFVTAGASAALTAATALFADAGDTILIPSPGYPGYGMFASVLGVKTTGYSLDPADDWRPNLEQIEQGLRDGARAIVLNSPNNPTGSLISPDDLATIIDLCRRYDAWVIADEVYHSIQFTGEVMNAYRHASDRTIAVYSFSKTYSMTGFRIGIAIVPEQLREKFSMLMLGAVSSVAQQAGLRVLETEADYSPMRAHYRDRQGVASDALAANGLESWEPAGTFYRLVALPESVGDAMDFAVTLVDAGVATVPGPAFGDLLGSGTRYVRLSLTRPNAEIREAIAIIARAARGVTA
jgi:aspartate/methionine/tyrosine aminotransferase